MSRLFSRSTNKQETAEERDRGGEAGRIKTKKTKEPSERSEEEEREGGRLSYKGEAGECLG